MMEKGLHIASLSVIMLLCFAEGIPVKLSCRDQPADIVFVLDSSSSIWPPDYMRQIHFVENVTSEFNIGPSNDQSRVAVLTFSNRKHVEFHLNNISAIQNIAKIPYRTGGTNTAEAIAYLATDMFKEENGGRQNVPHIAIVITDGQSWDQNATAVAAKRAKKLGIQIFAIGVGKGVNINELKNISSDPDKKFVFNVSNYRDLQQIKQSLTKRACEEVTKAPVQIKNTTPVPTTESTTVSTTVSTPESTTVSTTVSTPVSKTASTPVTSEVTTPVNLEKATTEKLQADREKLTKACGGKPADVYFLLDSSSSIRITEFNKQLGFVRDVVDIFDIAPNKTRVGISTFSHEYKAVISLDQYNSKESLVESITKIPYLRGGTSTGAALQKVREIDFAPSKTRQEVAHVLIVMTDGLSRNPDSTAIQARLTKSDGTYVFAIGIGDNVDKKELRNIASPPDNTVENYVFHVDTFDALESIKSVLAISTCDVAGYQQDQGGCRIHNNVDLMFAYDSARFGYKESGLIMDTVAKLAMHFEKANGNIRTGVLSSSCTNDQRDISLGAALVQNEYEHLTNAGYSGLEHLLRKLRMSGFSSSNGGRRGASRIAVVFVDTVLGRQRDIELEVKRARFQNLEFVFVAIGNDMAIRQLQGLSKLPGLSKQMVIQVPDIQHLSGIHKQLSLKICKDR